MVDTSEIKKASDTISEADQNKAGQAVEGDGKLDDIMLAMDVVDTLRHERLMLEKDLNADNRREALIERLREIYDAQGIEVPDSVLMDGVLALEEQRFVYEPPQKSFSTRLAKIYVGRRKWLPLFYTVSFILAGATAINYFGFVRPQHQEIKKVESVLDALPNELTDARQAALELAKTKSIKTQINNIYDLAQDDLENRDIQKAREKLSQIEYFSNDLKQVYELRIVSRPQEMSGVFRLNNDGPTEVTNYYLIVEAVAPDGSLVNVPVTSEEDQSYKRTNRWGLRVPKSVFDQVAADKRDDQIIQNAIIGQKQRGYIEPEYSVETSGGKILDW